jgi:hypothetical protein
MSVPATMELVVGAGGEVFVVLLEIHDPQNIDPSWIKHTARAHRGR